MSFPEPETESVDGSDAKLINRARSEGLIGAASTLIRTSSYFGTGFSTVPSRGALEPAEPRGASPLRRIAGS